MRSELQRTNARSAAKLGVVFVAMFGFSFALVPLYDLLCDVTGFGGRTGVVQAKDLDGVVDERVIKVMFLANTNSALPWQFAPTVKSMSIHPGEVYETSYMASNDSTSAVVGQAIPNVSPPQASKYFNKTECFCFDNQRLEAGEQKRMPVRFVVDRALPKSLKTVTLSYTFFKVEAGNG
jgi:cytochrome c oxidase assembly protein subunit 11